MVPKTRIRKFLGTAKFCAVLFLLLTVSSDSYAQTRLKDIAMIQGVETGRLTGLGLVTGLRGTGDGTQIIPTIRAMTNVLKNFGITIDENKLRMRNAALVMISADIPPFSKRGAKFDITVSSLGDAQSLEGGILTQANLLDMNQAVAATAQGPVSIGGLNVQGAGTQNFTASGRIVKGGALLQDMSLSYESEDEFRINLYQPDFTTAFRVAQSIDRAFGNNTAYAQDPATIVVKMLPPYNDNNRQVEYISMVEQLMVATDVQAKVVINERTGTVIVGAEVKLSEVLITHGDLTITITPDQAQPDQQIQGQAIYLNKSIGSSIGDLASALNALQVAPRDMIAIFQALKAQGALKAELVIM
ncbi:MAG: flagellar basal body P-ring protein FlgI [bacterium]|nr:flagellar basal body P-ring protein FlgI [bacterium]